MNLLGVYEISIENKDTINEEIYIGSTVRSIRRRVEEHKADIEKSKGSIALAQIIKLRRNSQMGPNESAKSIG